LTPKGISENIRGCKSQSYAFQKGFESESPLEKKIASSFKTGNGLEKFVIGSNEKNQRHIEFKKIQGLFLN
jgi:hypothetical protein